MKNLAVAAFLLTIPTIAQTPGTVFPAGSTVDLGEFGVSFQIPQGWSSTSQNQPGAFSISSTDGNLAGFLFLKTGISQSEMKSFFADKTGGITRMEQTAVSGYNAGWSFDFVDAGAGVQGTGRAVLSASSRAALVIVMARTIPAASLGGFAESWIRTLRFAGADMPRDSGPSQGAPLPVKPPTSNPLPASSANPFSGRQIHAVKSYSGGDYFELTTISLDLCGDGTYSALIKKDKSSTSGILGPSQKTDRETGNWSISGTAPQWALTLRTSQGLSSSVPIRTVGGLKFGDMPAELLQTVNCR